MKGLEARLEALEHRQELIRYVLHWADEPIDPDAVVIRLKWEDDL